MKKKGFTLIELLAVIVILAVIALIVTPIVTGIIKSAKEQANARSVEGHVKNIENAIILNAFARAGDMKAFDNKTKTEIEAIVTAENDPVTCSSYTILNGTVQSAEGCSATGWSKTYTYTIGNGAQVAEGSESENSYTMAVMCPGCKFYDMHDNEYDSYEDAVASNLEINQQYDDEEYQYEGDGYLAVYAYIYGVVEVEIDEDTTAEEIGVVRAFVCGSLHDKDPFCLEASDNDEEVMARNVDILSHFFDFDNECTYNPDDEFWQYECGSYESDIIAMMNTKIVYTHGVYEGPGGVSIYIYSGGQPQVYARSQHGGLYGWYY